MSTIETFNRKIYFLTIFLHTSVWLTKSTYQNISCIVSISQTKENLNLKFYNYGNNSHCIIEKFEKFDLITLSSVIDKVSRRFYFCHLFTENIDGPVPGNVFQQTHLKQHYHNKRPSTAGSHEFCNNELYVDTLSKIPQYFPYKEIVIFTENQSCYKYVAQRLRSSIEHKYQVTIYDLKFSKTNLLKDVMSKLYLYDRIFFFLCSTEVMDFILKQAALRKLSLPNNVWVIDDGHLLKSNELPYYTVFINHTVFDGYEPINMNRRNNDVVADVKCIEDVTQESSDDVIKVSLWHGSHLTDLFESRISKGVVTQLMYENDFQLKSAKNQLKPLKLLSISDGPFLAEAHYLYNDASKTCESSALLCWKYDFKTESWIPSCCYGFIADLYTALGKRLLFDVNLYLMPDMTYGAFDAETQSWNGMIGEIVRNEYDMAAPLTINTERMSVVDFSAPVIRAEMGIAVKKTEVEYKLFNLRVIGHIKITGILTALAFFCITILLIYVYDNTVLTQKTKVDLLKRKRNILKKYSFEESFSYVSGIMFQRDIGGKNPSTFAGRGVAIFCAFAMVALITLYTASLTVDQVTKVANTQFQGLTDPKILNPTDEFPYGTIEDTSIEDFFKRSTNPQYQNIYKFMKKYNQKSLSVAIDKLLKGELGAFLDDRPFLVNEISKGEECLIEIHPNEVATVSYGIALHINSTWTLPVSEAIVKLKDEGFIEKLENKWLYLECPTQEQGEFKTFGVTFFGTPTAILLGAAVLSLFIMLVEMFYKRYVLSKKHLYTLRDEQSEKKL